MASSAVSADPSCIEVEKELIQDLKNNLMGFKKLMSDPGFAKSLEANLIILHKSLSYPMLVEDSHDCLRSLIKAHNETVILQMMIYLFMAIDKMQKAEEKEIIVQTFNLILHELQNKPNEDLVVNVVNTFLHVVLTNIRPSNAEYATSILSMHHRFASISRLRSQLLRMFDIGGYFCTGVLLGSGTIGSVYKGFHKETGNVVAIKAVAYTDKSAHHKKALKREVQMMKYMSHPNIVRLYDALKDDKYLYLVMELSPLGDLENWISNYSTKHGRLSYLLMIHFMHELANGLKFLRSKMIVHRDLKPDNFLVFEEENGKEMRLKLSDFTSARQLNDGELTKSLWGTPIYMAPELLDHKKYTDKADLWSVGVIMYRLLYNSLPYTGQSWAELANNIKTLPLTFPVNVEIGDDARDLLMRLLRRDPYERISWEEFFTHSFFTNPVRQPSAAPDSPKSMEALRQEMQQQLNKFKDAFHSSQQQIKLLEQQLKEAHEREGRMEELISQMRDKDQSEDTDSMRRRLTELEKERAIWMSSAESRLGTDKSTEALVNSLKSEIEQLKKSNTKGNKINFQELELGFREQIEVLNRRIKELELENSGHSEQYNTIMNLFKKDVEDIEQSNSKLMKEKNALEEELKRYKLFEAENKSLQQICRQLKEKEEEKDRQMLGMADEVEKLRRDNASYEKQYIEILSESLKSEENSKLNDETISLLREKLRETELILAECQKDREQLTQELSRYRTVSSGEFSRSSKREDGKEDKKERARGNSGKS